MNLRRILRMSEKTEKDWKLESDRLGVQFKFKMVSILKSWKSWTFFGMAWNLEILNICDVTSRFSKICNLEILKDLQDCSRWCNLEILKSWIHRKTCSRCSRLCDLEILNTSNMRRHHDCRSVILKSWNLEILNVWSDRHLEILKSWNLEILNMWRAIDILKTWKLEILNVWRTSINVPRWS